MRRSGFSVIRELSGHGIGRTIHEEPSVPNYASARQVLTKGLVITVERIVNATNRGAWMFECRVADHVEGE